MADTQHFDRHWFVGQSIGAQGFSLTNACSAVGDTVATNFGYSITNMAGAGLELRTLAYTNSSATTLTQVVCTLIKDLRDRKLLP